MSDGKRGSAVEVELLRVPEAARILGIGTTKIYELMAAGEIEYVKLGTMSRRIPRGAVDDFVARLRGGHVPAGVSRRRLPKRTATVGRRYREASELVKREEA
jgi:excisionase family DNA binding protein